MRYAKIGGQALIEGIMMRFGDDYSVAVRKPDHTIEIKRDKHVSLAARLHVSRVPVIRGALAFIDSLVLGMSTLTYSASFFEEEEGQEQTEKDADGWYTTEIKVPGGLDYYFIINQGNGKPQTKDYGPISCEDYPEIWVVIQDDLVGKNNGDWCKYYNYNPDLEN